MISASAQHPRGFVIDRWIDLRYLGLVVTRLMHMAMPALVPELVMAMPALVPEWCLLAQ